MKLLALLLVISACEHDPRYERHADHRPPPPAAVVPVDAAPAKTVERRVVDIPGTPAPPRPPHRRHR